MFGWGITLMAVGGLSFVLPIFGRQFIVVSALGLTGMGSAMAGIVLFAIGVMLFNAAKKEEETERARFFSNHDVQKATVTPAPSAASTKASQPQESTSPKAESKTPHFTLPNGQAIDPHTFGVVAAKIGIEHSEQAVDSMIGNAELPTQRAIGSRKGAVQLHVLALITGAHYVCAYKLANGNKQVLSEVGQGISDGFVALFSDESGKLSNPNNPHSLYELFQDYAKALAHELDSTNSETLGADPFDMGSTARLVVQNIGGQCEIQDVLANSPLERMMLEKIAATYGEALLIRLLLEKQFSYSS